MTGRGGQSPHKNQTGSIEKNVEVLVLKPAWHLSFLGVIILGELHEFICPKCGKRDIWACKNSIVMCNSCYRWIRLKDIKNPNPCKISDKDKTEQLKLF